MKPRYLLPCSCGREIPVETGQAGELVRCACGATVEVPTLLRMRALKPAAPEAAAAPPPATRWGMRQRLLLLGTLIVLVFGGLALRAYSDRPQAEEVFTYASLESLTYVGVWQIWQDLQQGVTRHATKRETLFGNSVKYYRLWMGFYLALTAAGGLTILSGFFFPAAPAATARSRSPA